MSFSASASNKIIGASRDGNFLTVQNLAHGNFLLAFVNHDDGYLTSRVIDAAGTVLRTDVLSEAVVSSDFVNDIFIGPDGRRTLTYLSGDQIIVQHFSDQGVPEEATVAIDVATNIVDVTVSGDGAINILEVSKGPVDTSGDTARQQVVTVLRKFAPDSGDLIGATDLEPLSFDVEVWDSGIVSSGLRADLLTLTSGEMVASVLHTTSADNYYVTDGSAQASFARVSDTLQTVVPYQAYAVGSRTHDFWNGIIDSVALPDGGWAFGYAAWAGSPPGLVVHRLDADGSPVFDSSVGRSGYLLGLDLVAGEDDRLHVTYSLSEGSRLRGTNSITTLDLQGDTLALRSDGTDRLPLSTSAASNWYQDLVVLKSGGGFATFFLGENRGGDIFFNHTVDLHEGTIGKDLLRGTDAPESFLGLEANDTIQGLGGADLIAGGSGADSLEGGDGDDTIEGGTGADFIDGGAGNDLLFGSDRAGTLNQERSVTILGGDGNDEIVGSREADILDGGADDDVIYGRNKADAMSGGAGNDTLYGEQGADTLDGGSGADRMHGGLDQDVYYVDDLGDVVVETPTGSRNDTVYASVDFRMEQSHIENLYLTGAAILGAGNGLANEIRGNREANILDGGRNNDTLMGGAGNDTYFVRAPGDTVIEAAGRGQTDTVRAFRSYELTANVERLFMQTVYTKDGNPAIFNAIGNEENNTIVGTPFANTIAGRGGRDTLKGQAGADTFVFDRELGPDNVDRIIDFNTNSANEGDTLKLKSAVFTGLADGALDASVFALGAHAQDAADRLIFEQASGRLWYDADGTGPSAQILFATFDQDAILTPENIEIF
ncbi:calcium-binding protein [Oceaniglobus trochenteri]|uniref:calcium-binding protein n=1 Tax=Oceaniglobus trochenteri TaxID=2763260 RepID=UPI001CFFB02A|nr:calcium-binding protein [Oceaniglobus trochenteri]